MTTLNSIKQKLEKESTAHIEAKATIAELNQQINDLATLVSISTTHHRHKSYKDKLQ